MKNFDEYRGDSKPYGVCIDPCKVTEKGTDYTPVCDNCYYSFDTIEEARDCARTLAEESEPTSYLVKIGRRTEWRTSKPDNPANIVGFSIDCWTVSPDSDSEQCETYNRFDSVSEMLEECFKSELLDCVRDEIDFFMVDHEDEFSEDPIIMDGGIEYAGNLEFTQSCHDSKTDYEITVRLIDGQYYTYINYIGRR